MSPPKVDRIKWNVIGEVVALGIAIGSIYFLARLPVAGVDLRHAYIPAASGELSGVYNPDWARPLFELLAAVPFRTAYVGLMVLSLFAVALATLVFRGRLVFVLMTYQFPWILFYGQIDALAVLGLAAGWWALERRNGWLAGVGFAMASIKPQMSGPALILLWWWLDWPDRLKSLVVPALLVLGSCLRYGWWVPAWFAHLSNNALSRLGSITLWEHVGPFALLLWIPALLSQLPRSRKLVLFLVTTALTMPYYQHYQLLAIQSFPIGPIAWLGNVGFLFPIVGSVALEMIVLLPLGIYGWYVWDGLRRFRHA